MSPTETAPSTKREIEVAIPPEEVSRETEVLIQKYQKLARIPGFRKGHVPASIIRQRFSQDIQNDVVDALVPKYFRKEAERLGTEFLGEVPLDLKIRETSDGGTPITVADPENPHALVFRQMAARIWEKVAGESADRRPPPRIVIE